MNTNPIIQAQERKIKEREQQISILEEVLKAELSELQADRLRLEGMLSMLGATASLTTTAPDVMASSVQTAANTQLLATKRKRPISEKWTPIFHHIENHSGRTADELTRYAKDKHGIERKLLMAQVAYYIKQGLMHPPEANGKILLTDEGRRASGAYNPHMNDHLGPMPDYAKTIFSNIEPNL